MLFYDDVKDFKVIPGDTVVEGYWRIEGNVKSLSVYKKKSNRSGIPVSRSWYEGLSLECSPDGRDYRPSILPHR